jgi:hypothetical protein
MSLKHKRDLDYYKMKEWFLENYSDPVNVCPYETEDGGYQYIWGGPYNPEDVLMEKYSKHIEEDIIISLANELENISDEWSKMPPSDDEYISNIISENISPYSNYVNSIEKVENHINSLKTITLQDNYLYKLLFANVITILETFLLDFIINKVFNNKEYLIKFVSNCKEFKETKISYSDIYKEHSGIEEKVKKLLFSYSWHNLGKIKPIYEMVFDLSLPKIDKLMGSIMKRHDIVHRNGKSKDGSEIFITVDDIRNVIIETNNFVNYIDDSIDKFMV